MEKKLKKVTKNAKETQQLAKEFVKELVDGGIVALYGDLGSGKTTFVQGLAHTLGISQRITSPTFIIMRSYEMPGKKTHFYHIDLYRTETKEAITGLGLKEIMNDMHNIIIIEWPERLGEDLPKDAKKIHFAYISEQEREIYYE